MEEAFYDRYAELESTHWWFIGRRAIVARVLASAAIRASDPILEVGCGTGGMLGLLRRVGHAYGVDISHTALAAARAQDHAVVRADSGRLPFDDDTFPLVCAFDVLEHIQDDATALRELRRVCRPGGRLVLSVPAFPFLWGRQDIVSHHYRRYVKPQLLQRLREAGFITEYTTYFNTWLFPFIAAIRVSRALRGSQAVSSASDFDVTPPKALNALLARVFASEAIAIGRCALPVGVSLLSVGRRPC